MSSSPAKPVHRVYAPDGFPEPGGLMVLTDAEAHHAVQVKRVRMQDVIAIHDGQGRIAQAVVESLSAARRDTTASVRIVEVHAHPAPATAVEVWSAMPKGERAAQVVDQLSQVGATAWRPLLCARSETEVAPKALDRLRRVAVESMKQCARAWLMDVGEAVRLPSSPEPGVVTLAGDQAGTPAGELDPSGTRRIRLLVGPEGGFTAAELAELARAGVGLVRFGPHILRIETAAVVGAAVILAHRTMAS